MSREVDFSRRIISVDAGTLTLPPILGLDKVPEMPLKHAIDACKNELEYKAELVENALNLADDVLFMNGGADEWGLTRDEIAAIGLYTLEGVYQKLNERLREENRAILKSLWFPYLKLLLSALQKLPDTDCLVYRGVNPKNSIVGDYVTGRKLTWWQFTSCTTDGTVVTKNECFMGKTGPNRVLFAIRAAHGKDIRKYSFYKRESEVLLAPGTRVEVENSIDFEGATLINVRELENSYEKLVGGAPRTNASSRISPEFAKPRPKLETPPKAQPMGVEFAGPKPKPETVPKCQPTSSSKELDAMKKGSFVEFKAVEMEAKSTPETELTSSTPRGAKPELTANVVVAIAKIEVGSSLGLNALIGKRVDDQDCEALAEAINRSPTAIKALWLSHNRIGDEGAKALATAIRANKIGHKLVLNFNNIGNEGARQLATALRSNTTMTQLHLIGNQIGDDGAEGMADAIRTYDKRSRQLLFALMSNHIGPEGLQKLRGAVKANPSSKVYLNLGGQNGCCVVQ